MRKGLSNMVAIFVAGIAAAIALGFIVTCSCWSAAKCGRLNDIEEEYDYSRNYKCVTEVRICV